MSSFDLNVYIPVLILMGMGVLMVAGAILVGSLLRPNKPNELKNSAYECGETPVGTAWSNFNVRFYVVSLIFIIFDVEGALMFPVAAVFRDFNRIGAGGIVLGTFLIFILVLILGVVYCWSKGDLDWVKSFQFSDKEGLKK